MAAVEERCICVSNLPYNVKKDVIKFVFPEAINIQISEYKPGSVILEFNAVRDAEAYARKNRAMMIENNLLTIQRLTGDRYSGDNYSESLVDRQIYVMNLPPNTSEDYLHVLFPGAKKITILKMGPGVKSKSAVAEFRTAKEAQSQLSRNGILRIDRNELYIELVRDQQQQCAARNYDRNMGQMNRNRFQRQMYSAKEALDLGRKRRSRWNDEDDKVNHQLNEDNNDTAYSYSSSLWSSKRSKASEGSFCFGLEMPQQQKEQFGSPDMESSLSFDQHDTLRNRQKMALMNLPLKFGKTSDREKPDISSTLSSFISSLGCGLNDSCSGEDTVSRIHELASTLSSMSEKQELLMGTDIISRLFGLSQSGSSMGNQDGLTENNMFNHLRTSLSGLVDSLKLLICLSQLLKKVEEMSKLPHEQNLFQPAIQQQQPPPGLWDQFSGPQGRTVSQLTPTAPMTIRGGQNMMVPPPSPSLMPPQQTLNAQISQLPFAPITPASQLPMIPTPYPTSYPSVPIPSRSLAGLPPIPYPVRMPSYPALSRFPLGQNVMNQNMSRYKQTAGGRK